MAGLAKYFPHSASLLKQKATIPHVDLAGKTVFFYFSASWCPPCRGFTPQLVEFYTKYHVEKNFEVIFASWDEEADDFKEYYAKMPWLAIPFGNVTIKALTDVYQVQSIPTLIGVEADTGKTITTQARTMVVKDPEGTGFPWPN